MKFNVEEINLMCIYDFSSRYALIQEMEESLPYAKDPEIQSLMERTIAKLYEISDKEFADLPLFPADYMEEFDLDEDDYSGSAEV